MRSVRRFVGTVIGLLLVASALPGTVGVSTATASPADGQAPAGVGPETWTVEAVSFDVMTGPDRDIQVTIDADLWKPDGASAAAPVPAVVHQHGYGGKKANAEQRTNAAYFASHGYAVVTVSTQGFGRSTGCIALDTIDYDGANTIAIIDWLAEQDFIAKDGAGDPQVGLMGGSYGGGHQGLVAIEDDRVDAIAPGRTWSTLQFSLVPNNAFDPADPWDLDGYEQGVFKQQWTSLFFALGQTQPAMGNGGCSEPERQQVYPGSLPCSGYIPGVCEIYNGLTATGTSDEAGRTLVAGSARATRLDELTTPTIIAQGLPDTLFTPNETIADLLSLQERDVPVAVFWHSAGHGGYQPAPGDGEPYGGSFDETADRQAEFADTYWARRHLAWFDRYVRGDETVDTGPTFAWFRPWVDYDVEQTGGTSAPAYGTATAYPPPQSEELVLTLDPADASLAAPDETIEGGTSQFVNPQGGSPAAYSETANFSSPGRPGDVPPTEQPGQFAEFTTAPFDEPVEVVGVPDLRVHLAHDNPAQDAVVFVKLYDVAPDGTATLIRRQVAPARLTNEQLEAGAVDIHLVGTSWRFEAGHAARLVVAATDQAYFNNRLVDQLTISSTSDEPSTLTIPTVPGAADDVGADAGSADSDAAVVDDAADLAATGGGAALVAVLLIGAALLLARARRD